MSFDEFMALAKSEGKTRKRPTREEHYIQCASVKWFRMAYPYLKSCLFAVPNGGKRDAITAEMLCAEGVVAGVSDLILLRRNKKYGALLIEMKTQTGRQTQAQRNWQALVCASNDYKYVICRSLQDFIREVEDYLELA